MQNDTQKSAAQSDVREFIANNPLFANLDPKITDTIASLSQIKMYNASEYVFHEGEPGNSFYIIKEGHVKILTMENKDELVAAGLNPGEGFGELALLVNQPRTFSAKASDDVALIQIKRKDLDDLIRVFPELLVQLNRLMAESVSLLDVPEHDSKSQKHRLRTEYRLELDPAILDLLFQLNEVAGGQEQVQHCKETAMLAREMSKMLCPMVNDPLFYAGYLHEIGKISLSRDLVTKERTGQPITDEEKALVSRIFSIAANILKPDRVLYESVNFIDFMDRDSYLEMPLEAQILVTADDYLMKISKNYGGLSSHEALFGIMEGTTLRFNPRVVAALEKTVEKFNSLKVEKQLIFIKQMNIALDYKDHYTLSHSIHTREMSEKIGRRLELSQRDLEILRYGCDLHDVGKIYIPTNILVAPRKLTDEEMQVMQSHAVYSAQFFQDIPGMDELTDIIKHHHEKYNGTGYPDGLKGKEIPLISRIMVIADVYSALTTKRPYRLDEKGDKVAFSPTKALEIMENMQGHFDPTLFNIFKKIITEEEEKRD